MDEKAKLIKDYARMCDKKRGIDCDVCELNKNKKYSSCELFMMKEPEKAVEIIEKWSDEHQIKTRQDKFLEQYPDTLVDAQGIINISPCMIERQRFNQTKDCSNPNISCRECREQFWGEELKNE